MLLLALDTSTHQSSIALCSEHELYGEYTWNAGGNHSVELLGHIRAMLVQSRVSTAQLEAVGVAIGPGSFNSVRVALTAAKSLAFALQIPLIGISTLDIVAAQQQNWPGLVCALQEAGRGELYAACYRADSPLHESKEATRQYRQVTDYLLLPPDQLVAQLQKAREEETGQTDAPVLFCGEYNESSEQGLRGHMPGEVFFAGRVFSARRASLLALLALRRLQAGSVDDPLRLEPLYLRRPSITKSTRKQPLLGGLERPTEQPETEREEGALRH